MRQKNSEILLLLYTRAVPSYIFNEKKNALKESGVIVIKLKIRFTKEFY